MSLSFVVQGPVYTESKIEEGIFSTRDVLESIRHFFPNAEVILSTWEESDLSKLSYDKVVLNKDPGAITFCDGSSTNCNRLIVSTVKGVLAATEEYLVKTRTDILFTSSNLQKHLEQIQPTKSVHAIFENVVLSTVYYVRDSLLFNCHFHASDIFLVGKKQDILSYFDVPLATASTITDENNYETMVTEQYLFTSNLRTKKDFVAELPRAHTTSMEHFATSERTIFNSYTFLDLQELGIAFPEKLLNAHKPEFNYTLKDAKSLTSIYKKKKRLQIILRSVKYYYKQVILFKIKVTIKKWMGPALLKKVGKQL